MNYAVSRGAPQIVRSKAPAGREPKRPNGHKVQLALRRDIEDLHSQLERHHKATSSALKRISELENQLLAVGADRDGWRARSEAHTQFMAQLEELFGLDPRAKTWEERREHLMRVLDVVRAAASAPR